MDSRDEINKFLLLSPVKRDRIKKEQARINKQKLREQLPVYNAQEIRKLRLDYHEAIYLNFEEDGCPNSAELLKNLIDYQTELREKNGPQSLFWANPILKNSRQILDDLAEKFEIAEKAHEGGNYEKEWEVFLQLGALYGFGSSDWHWLGKQFLYICCTFDYAGDYVGRYRALSNYLLGKFLISNDQNLEDAKPYLETSRALAKGQHWSSRKYIKEKEETIFMESCGLLYEVLYQEAKTLMKIDPEAAIKICVLARKMASEACHHFDEFTAYLLKGNCEMVLNEVDTAIITYRRALSVATARNFTTGVCEARIQLAIAYLQIRKSDEATENLQELKKFAEENQLPYYVARAYRFLGEFFLNEGDVITATKLLEAAFYLFNGLNDLVNRAEVRNLLAISAGQKGLEKYTELIRSCDGSEESKDKLLALIRWKENREPFWEASKQAIAECDDVDDIEKEISAEDLSDVKVLRCSTYSSIIPSIFSVDSYIIRTASHETTLTTVLPHTKATENLTVLGKTSDISTTLSEFREKTISNAGSISTEGFVPS